MSVVLPDIHCRPEWPFESYASAWLQFRALTDENRVTADHILSRSGWPRTLPNLRMADFGCGDGRLIETLLSTVQQPVSTVHLTDINPELLEQASERIKRLKSVQYVDAVCQSAGDAMLRMANDIDAALAVHLLYLPGEDETRRFLTAL
ncbi:MAG TPA: class I SAM-dependent methyltransferase, partial [Blastocatellia bacterium]|nr:class I SAM-dependent methyltransferase [Blastocatellia bacterium]